MKIIRDVSSVALFAALFSMLSCQRETEYPKVDLPPTSVLSVRSDWGVVTSNVLRMRSDPNQSATILTHIRLGELVEILSRTVQKDLVDEQTAYWYQVNYGGLRGWLFGSYLEIFDTRAKATDFSREVEE